MKATVVPAPSDAAAASPSGRAGTFLEFIAAGADHARVAGRWRARSRATGRDIGIADALIAACAADARASVLTRNARDFALTPVAVETY